MAPSPEFVITSRTTQPHSIHAGWLTEATRSPCTGGKQVGSFSVDGATNATQLPSGEHELRVRFESLRRELEMDLVVDIHLDDGLCVRVPVLSQVIPMVAEKRLAIVAATPMEGHGRLGGLNGYIGFTLGAGGWLGPALVTGNVGIAGALCNPETCPKTSEGKLQHGFAIPLNLAVQYYPTSVSREGFLTAPFVGVRYAYVSARLPAEGGDRRVGVHGIHALLGWGVGDGVADFFRHRERSSLIEFGIPLGIWVDPEATGNKVAFGGGFEVRLRMVP